jgi:integrase
MRGSIQPLGGDRYKVRIYAGIDPVTKKERVRSKTFHFTGKAADRKTYAEELAGELRRSIDEAAQNRDTIAGLAKKWLELKRRQGRSPTTLEAYESHVAAIVKRFGTTRVVDLTGMDIDDWYGELIDERDKKTKQPVRTASTVRHYHATLRGMLRQAEKWGMTTTVATRRASPPEVIAKEILPPTTAVLAVLLNDAGTGEFANILRFTAATGLRAGEVSGLLWSDIVGDELTVRRAVIELKGGGWTTKPPKGKRARRMTIGTDVLQVLADQRAWIDQQADIRGRPRPTTGPVFPDMLDDDTGQTPRRPGWISHKWITLRNRHGVTFRFHDLRHWNATAMLNDGVPIATVSKRLGHAKESITRDVYSHVVEGTDRAAAEVMTRLAPKRLTA